MATVVSLINMKGGVGKSTLTFNLAWYSAWFGKLRVLAIDLDPQANLSQYFLGARYYLKLISKLGTKTIVDIFEQFSAPSAISGAPTLIEPNDIIAKLEKWSDGSLLDLVPSRLELAWTLKNPTEKAQLLPQFISKVEENYDLILIDCAPTESILTNAAYRSSRYLFVPVKPEFLATIGLPLLARSLNEFRLMHENQQLDMGGIIFNDKRRSNTPPEQEESCRDVEVTAKKHGWRVFENIAHHSDSFATGSREGTSIFQTPYARDYVKDEFSGVAKEFLKEIDLK
uniref:Chromosome partitioning protein n=1 Tax=Candidatus Kentrum sp. LFY TaxID=2126342 RepID=A0A450UG11_9GAMM|nr:MAG: chromosome partitioning protein [Candidatus Kentron sp. LFY]VFJ91497.1 MAG: chromosome partitioning protein [Candidatus Kentron sp. LFY]